MCALDVVTMSSRHGDRTTSVDWRWWEPVLIFAIALPILWGLIVFFDETHRATANGLWKSIDMRRWVEHQPERTVDPANLLYFPVLGQLLRLLPEPLFGPVWRRMAFFNGACGAGVLALTYLIACRLFRSRTTAAFACLAQLSMAFFLLLSRINEDIMPGYFWFVAALACAVVPRRRATLALILSAQCLALSWLFHSSLQLPGIGAFVAGVLLGAGSIRAAVRRVALFCVALIPLPTLSALHFGLPWSLGWWTGKGLGTGWAGFTANKVVFLWSGVSESVFRGRNIASLDEILTGSNIAAVAIVWFLLACAAILWLRTAWREYEAPEWRLATGVLVSVFILGEAMNLYIQPQDPQMQIQPMTWVPFAAACVYWVAGRFVSRGPSLRAALTVGALVLIGVNVGVYLPTRHSDSTAQANVRTMQMLAPREKTVFLFQGFEGLNPWLAAEWGPGTDQPLPGGPEVGHYNVIYVTSEATIYPDRLPEDSAENIVGLVEHALDQGFDVVAGDIWASSEAQWIDGFATISGSDKPIAIRKALHEAFEGTPIGIAPGWTALYKLKRKRAVAQGVRISA